MVNLNKYRKKNIALVGLMGSGKTVLGKKLAKSQNLKFYDSDKTIENITKLTINDIFSKYGENYFRKIEKEVAVDLLKKNNSIISLGGGSILDSNVRKYIKKNSFSVYLKVDLDTLTERLKNSKKRPLLTNVDIKKKLIELYEERKNFYNESDLVIQNNNNVNEIISLLKLKLKENE